MSDFLFRHIGISDSELHDMLNVIGVNSLDELMDETIPSSIRKIEDLNLPEALSEYEYMLHIKNLAEKNYSFKSLIGQGYYGTITPSPILRNIFQNPGWYTQYTPYQSEISQGRLEALLNFQTMVSDLTGLPLANASLLDEGTAAAEAMTMFYQLKNKRNKGDLINRILVDQHVFQSTKSVLESRANPLNIEIQSSNFEQFDLNEKVFAILLQYPDAIGEIHNYKAICDAAREKDIYVIVAADLLSLTLLTPPGE